MTSSKSVKPYTLHPTPYTPHPPANFFSRPYLFSSPFSHRVRCV
ncbi:hypothetical protein [Microcystis sp. M169S2]|nr:hypothetical protein [Microcystis sp. M169S2]